MPEKMPEKTLKKITEKKTARQIPEEKMTEVETSIEKFNRKKMKDVPVKYVAAVSGKNVLIGRQQDHRLVEPMCRLQWNKEESVWDFAIYRYSRDGYDPDADFPGSGLVDGTVEGALLAVHKAYPPDYMPGDGGLISLLSLFSTGLPMPAKRSSKKGKNT